MMGKNECARVPVPATLNIYMSFLFSHIAKLCIIAAINTSGIDMGITEIRTLVDAQFLFPLLLSDMPLKTPNTKARTIEEEINKAVLLKDVKSISFNAFPIILWPRFNSRSEIKMLLHLLTIMYKGYVDTNLPSIIFQL